MVSRPFGTQASKIWRGEGYLREKSGWAFHRDEGRGEPFEWGVEDEGNRAQHPSMDERRPTHVAHSCFMIRKNWHRARGRLYWRWPA